MTVPTANMGFSATPARINWPRAIATTTYNRTW